MVDWVLNTPLFWNTKQEYAWNDFEVLLQDRPPRKKEDKIIVWLDVVRHDQACLTHYSPVLLSKPPENRKLLRFFYISRGYRKAAPVLVG